MSKRSKGVKFFLQNADLKIIFKEWIVALKEGKRLPW